MKHGPGTSERTKAGLSAGYGHLSVLHRFITSQDEGRASVPGDPKARGLIVGLASEIIFDMKYEIAHILSDDNSIGLQLAQIMRQHLPGRSRNRVSQVAPSGPGQIAALKYLHSPLTLKEDSNRNRSVAYVPCVCVIHPALEFSRWIDRGAPEARGSAAADDMIFCPTTYGSDFVTQPVGSGTISARPVAVHSCKGVRR